MRITRRSVREWLEKRFFLRIHMTLILLGTFLAGVVTTWMLMRGGVNVLALRYAIAVCASYLVFLLLVKLWLLYVRSDVEPEVDPIDVIDIATDAVQAPTLHASSDNSGCGWSFDFGDDLGGIVFMLVLIVIVVLLGGVAIYYIYTAPIVLGEAAFEAVLAAALARRAKKAEGSGWIAAVCRATVWPFIGVLALSIFLGWLAQNYCPEALKLRDAVNCASR